MNFVQPLEFIARSDHLARDSETTGCYYSASRARTFPMEFKSGEYKEHRFWPTFSGRDSGEEGGGGKVAEKFKSKYPCFSRDSSSFRDLQVLEQLEAFHELCSFFLAPFQRVFSQLMYSRGGKVLLMVLFRSG